MKKTFYFLFVLLLFSGNLPNVFAKTCIAGDLKVSTVSGITLFSNGTVIEDLPIILSKDVLGEKIIQQVRSDNYGKFSFGEIKSGKYFVIVRGAKILEPLTFLVKVKKKYGKKGAVGLKITMRSIFDCSSAETNVLNKIQ